MSPFSTWGGLGLYGDGTPVIQFKPASTVPVPQLTGHTKIRRDDGTPGR